MYKRFTYLLRQGGTERVPGFRVQWKPLSSTEGDWNHLGPMGKRKNKYYAYYNMVLGQVFYVLTNFKFLFLWHCFPLLKEDILDDLNISSNDAGNPWNHRKPHQGVQKGDLEPFGHSIL